MVQTVDRFPPVIDAKNGDDDAQQGTNSTADEDETSTTSLTPRHGGIP